MAGVPFRFARRPSGSWCGSIGVSVPGGMPAATSRIRCSSWRTFPGHSGAAEGGQVPDEDQDAGPPGGVGPGLGEDFGGADVALRAEHAGEGAGGQGWRIWRSNASSNNQARFEPPQAAALTRRIGRSFYCLTPRNFIG